MQTRLDPARIAFVTRAYPRMRGGIITVVIGPFQIAFFRAARLGDTNGMLISGAAIVAAMLVARYLTEPWMDRRFGRVRRAIDSVWQLLGPMAFGMAFVTVTNLDDWSLAAGGPSILMLALAGLGLWITIRDWPYRPHVIIFAAVCAAASAALGTAQADGAVLLRLRMMADAAAVGAWMLVGFFDLLMLRRVMPRKSIAENSGKNHADAI